MSFFKSIARIVHPVSRLFLKDKKKGGGPAKENPEDTLKQLEDELTSYGKIGETTQKGAIDRAKLAGTYAPTTAFREQAQAEADAAARQLKSLSEAKMDSLRTHYKDLTGKDIGLSTPQSVAPVVDPAAPPPAKPTSKQEAADRLTALAQRYNSLTGKNWTI